MRAPVHALAALLIGTVLAGCGVDCPPSSEADGVYAVFANVLEYTLDNPDDFPSYGSPANGWGEWALSFEGDDVSLSIDGQPVSATARWDTIECGNFTMSVLGVYDFGPAGSTHDFEADGEFAVFATQLEGTWTYSERWTSRDGEEGTFEAYGQVSGDAVR